MANKLYRYELAYFGELQGIGFITGLKDLGLANELIDQLVYDFDQTLPLPNFNSITYNKGIEYPASYFTEKGKERFSSSIQKIIEHVDSLNTEWEVIEEIIEDYTTVYEDNFQALVLKKY